MNRDMFTKEVTKIEQTLYRISKSILIFDQDCEDVVQDAILKAYDKLYTLQNDKYFKTWVVRILINECYSYKRKEKPKVPFDEYSECIKLEQKTNYNYLYNAIQELPEQVKITIVLYYVEGYSVEEVKKILKIPSGTVKSRLSRGRKLLKEKLEVEEAVNCEKWRF